MRITNPVATQVTALAYRRARRGGGSESVRLPVARIGVAAVPAGCDAVLVTGDLQGIGVSPWGGAPVLLGVALADHLAVWAGQGLLPPPQRLAVVLAGDLYSAPTADLRGATGDVTDVWLALVAAGCPLVAGVLGNHDLVDAGQLASLGPAAVLLDGDWVDHGGVRFAGVGGIVGDPGRPGRRDEASQLAMLGAALDGRPDVLILHEGPSGDGADQRGSPVLRRRLAGRSPALTVCGHLPWDRPVASLGTGHVLNVDGRVLLLTPDPTTPAR